MLPGAYHWIETDSGHYLCFNAITVAYVQPDGDRWRVTINFRGQTHTGRAGSATQGKRFIERWIAARPGFPTSVRRKHP